MKGKEVIQLYITDETSSVVTYNSVLRGFEKIELEPGESKPVKFSLTAKELEILDINNQWTFEPGIFKVMVGSSSQDIRLKGSFTITE